MMIADFDRRTVPVGEAITVTASVRNPRPADAPMVLVELPVPAGFATETDGLTNLQAVDLVGKVEWGPDGLRVYLRGLKAGGAAQLPYRLRALTPAKVTAAPLRVYEYYAPERSAATGPQALTVTGAE